MACLKLKNDFVLAWEDNSIGCDISVAKLVGFCYVIPWGVFKNGSIRN